MAARFNKEKLKNFILRRKLNSFGLMSLTVMSILVTLICALIVLPVLIFIILVQGLI
mgnify:CR=1 FL=1